MTLLKSVQLEGFRSIKSCEVNFRSLNIMIGANGAGKSNFVSFFKMMNEMMGGRLQQYISTTGRAQSNLYFGPKVTPQLSAQIKFEADNGSDTYFMRLFHAAGDSLVFAEETLSFLKHGSNRPQEVSLGSGHQETRVTERAKEGHPVAKVLRHLLNHCRVFHFHDTSQTARVRQYHYIGDNRFLMPDAANLAALLYRWKQKHDHAYDRVVLTIRQIAPFFEDFELETENNRDIILNWRHRKSDLVFGPHQLSDGTLRAICLITLLLQPEKELPKLIVVDEPELGLHPYSLNVIASLFQTAAHHTQILISTQSSTFLDNFNPEDVILVEREGESSRFSQPDTEALSSWLEDYSLGEVWEKNVIGGGPH